MRQLLFLAFLLPSTMCFAAPRSEKVRIIENIPAISTYSWWVDGRSSVTCSGASCTAYISPPASGTSEVHGTVLKLLRGNGTIVIAECLGKERLGADALADISGLAHSKTYRDWRMPESGDREIQAEFSTAVVKLTFANPRSDPSGSILSETYFIRGFLNPLAAPATSGNMFFTPDYGDRTIACGSLKAKMKVHTFVGSDGERSITLEPMSAEEGRSLLAKLPYSDQK